MGDTDPPPVTDAVAECDTVQAALTDPPPVPLAEFEGVSDRVPPPTLPLGVGEPSGEGEMVEDTVAPPAPPVSVASGLNEEVGVAAPVP